MKFPKMKMKLKAYHLFIILLLALILCGCFGNLMREGYTSNTYTGPEGNEATVYTSSTGRKAVAKDGSVYYNGNYDNTYNNANKTTYTGSDGNQATVYTGPQGNKAVSVNNSNDDNNNDNTTTTSASATTYTGRGIYRHQIPPGQEDLYILKSQVVPPVCPACPQSAACPRQKPCQPCPPCARCPEPSFECKKVPNYNSSNDQFLPRPVMNDFSRF
jgi:hypothetical protein